MYNLYLRYVVLVLLTSRVVGIGTALGEDSAADAARQTKAKPLLIGNWADPTVLRDGDDYYMTHSSFDYQPGLLVWHSKDLQTWRPICRAVVNQQGSIWAPDLIKHKGRYYIYYPAAGRNWVVTADTPHGPWSTPKSVGVGHIDPGHVAADVCRRQGAGPLRILPVPAAGRLS